MAERLLDKAGSGDKKRRKAKALLEGGEEAEGKRGGACMSRDWLVVVVGMYAVLVLASYFDFV